MYSVSERVLLLGRLRPIWPIIFKLKVNTVIIYQWLSKLSIFADYFFKRKYQTSLQVAYTKTVKMQDDLLFNFKVHMNPHLSKLSCVTLHSQPPIHLSSVARVGIKPLQKLSPSFYFILLLSLTYQQLTMMWNFKG